MPDLCHACLLRVLHIAEQSLDQFFPSEVGRRVGRRQHVHEKNRALVTCSATLVLVLPQLGRDGRDLYCHVYGDAVTL